MRIPRFILTIIALFSIAGGALAFKATRTLNVFYLDTVTTTVGGGFYSVCTVPTTLPYVPDDNGFKTIKASTGSINMTCPVISVVVNG